LKCNLSKKLNKKAGPLKGPAFLCCLSQHQNIFWWLRSKEAPMLYFNLSVLISLRADSVFGRLKKKAISFKQDSLLF